MPKRPRVPADVKRALYKEAGNKCANPGCPVRLQHLHHIRQWHVYRTHDERDMVAVCPTCHNHVHHGRLRIDDDTIHYWKQIRRPVGQIEEQIYVEPGDDCKVLLGSILMSNGRRNPQGIVVFELSRTSSLSFSISDGRFLVVHLVITDTSGGELVRIVDGHLTVTPAEPVTYVGRPGKYRITAPATREYIPEWVVLGQATNAPENLVQDGRFTVLELEVLDRGLVQVQGVWVDGDRALVIQYDSFSLCPSRERGFVHFLGYGDYRGAPKDLKKLPIIIYEGAINYSSVLSAALQLPGF